MGLKKVGIDEIVNGSKRLNGFLQSIDEDIKELQRVFNNNTKSLFNKIEELEKKIEKLK